ncbi:hypothetical protein [Ktedonospora formicarum]|uniref:Uncharacterized protein n=1 Tax=Ktedonospora formicarum TaxID=2778364 RepID=A0A8J3IHP1_9CHLR|nr:hypothetical protein [Ktedonospora formicarum]GHO51339.1 hypothetical protein KSX_95020 [Ktedonospora formicarum]
MNLQKVGKWEKAAMGLLEIQTEHLCCRALLHTSEHHRILTLPVAGFSSAKPKELPCDGRITIQPGSEKLNNHPRKDAWDNEKQEEWCLFQDVNVKQDGVSGYPA